MILKEKTTDNLKGQKAPQDYTTVSNEKQEVNHKGYP
nr:MAG TPA: hypothetical protein [Caudoviricetes sp.]